MQIPQTTPASTIVPLSGADIAIHNFAGISWHILLPYTLFAGGIMIYGQIRLIRGQRTIAGHKTKPVKKRKSINKSIKPRLVLEYIVNSI